MVALPDWMALAPALSLALASLVLLLADSIDPDSTNTGLLAGISVLGSLLSFGFAGWFITAGTGMADNTGVALFNSQLVVDQMALFFMAIVGSVTTLVVLASYDYITEHSYQAEFFALVLLSATGMSLLSAANSLWCRYRPTRSSPSSRRTRAASRRD